jgi:hypothetical protein
MAKRISIIGSTSPTASWRDDELQAFERDFLKKGVIQGINGAMAVSQRGAGANLSVDVAAGRALITITNTNLTPNKTYNVYFDCETDTGTATNLAIATADPTNPRIDIICAKVDVSQNPDASAGNIASVIVVTGTPAGSPSAPATPANCLLLANIAVAAGAASIVTANITDKRVYATSNSAVLLDIMRQGLANNAAVLAGTNTYTGAMNPPITSYIDGAVYFVIPANDCTGASTVDIGAGAKSVKKNGSTALAAGDLKAKCLSMLQYNLADDNLKLVSVANGAVSGATQTVSDKTTDYVVTSGDSGNALTTSGAVVPIMFTLPAPSAGLNFTFVANSDRAVLNAGTNSGTITSDNKDFTYLVLGAFRSSVKLTAINSTYWAITSLVGALAPYCGYVGGGEGSSNSAATLTSFEKLDFSNDTQSTVSAAVFSAATAQCGSGSNDILGDIMGGLNSSATAINSVAQMSFRTEIVIALTYTLGTARGTGAGGQSYLYAYLMGGGTGNAATMYTAIDRIGLTTNVGSVISAVLPSARGYQYAMCSPTSMYQLGGYNTGTTVQTTIYKMVTATETVSTPAAVLGAANTRGSSSYSLTNGYAHGGTTNGTVVYTLAFASDTESTWGAALATSKAEGAGLSAKKGYALGSGTNIEDLNYAAVTSSNLAAVLSAARYGSVGVQPVSA